MKIYQILTVFLLRRYKFEIRILYGFIAIFLIILLQYFNINSNQNLEPDYEEVEYVLKTESLNDYRILEIPQEDNLKRSACTENSQILMDKVKFLNPSLSKTQLYSKTNKNYFDSNSKYDFIDEIKIGGSWEPSFCQSQHRIALIVPYMNREKNLNTFIYNIHAYLQRHLLNYTIFVVEQVNSELFNKGVLMNAAFLEIFDKVSERSRQELRDYIFDCLVYHDVDLLPTGSQFDHVF